MHLIRGRACKPESPMPARCLYWSSILNEQEKYKNEALLQSECGVSSSDSRGSVIGAVFLRHSVIDDAVCPCQRRGIIICVAVEATVVGCLECFTAHERPAARFVRWLIAENEGFRWAVHHIPDG